MLDYKTMKFIRDDDKFREYTKNIKNTYVLNCVLSMYLNDVYLLYNTKTNIVEFSNAYAFLSIPKDLLNEVKTDIIGKHDIYIEERYDKDDKCKVCDRYKDLTCAADDKKCKDKNIIYKQVNCSSNIWVDLEEIEKIDGFLKEE